MALGDGYNIYEVPTVVVRLFVSWEEKDLAAALAEWLKKRGHVLGTNKVLDATVVREPIDEYDTAWVLKLWIEGKYEEGEEVAKAIQKRLQELKRYRDIQEILSNVQKLVKKEDPEDVLEGVVEWLE